MILKIKIKLLKRTTEKNARSCLLNPDSYQKLALYKPLTYLLNQATYGYETHRKHRQHVDDVAENIAKQKQTIFVKKVICVFFSSAIELRFENSNAVSQLGQPGCR